MQRRAAEDLKKLVTDALVERGFLYEGAKAFATPRRLALPVAGLPARAPDLREEQKGPRVGAPQAAIEGFLQGAGLTASIRPRPSSDPKKGEFYVAVIEKPGRADAGRAGRDPAARSSDFPWPKSMRWGAASAQAGRLALGAAAALHHRDLRPRDRDARGRAVRGRRDRGRRRPPTATASWRPTRSRCAASTTTSQRSGARQGRARHRPPQGHHPCTMPATSPSRRASSSSRTKACSRRSPASSNGRW